jgi:hypothetical protein
MLAQKLSLHQDKVGLIGLIITWHKVRLQHSMGGIKAVDHSIYLEDGRELVIQLEVAA